MEMEKRDEIAARLEALETRCRRLGVWCAGSTGLLLVGCLAAALQPKPRVVRAQAFLLENEAGEARGGMSCEGRDAILKLVGDQEREGVVLGVGAGRAFPMAELSSFTVSSEDGEGMGTPLGEEDDPGESGMELGGTRLTGIWAWSDADGETWLQFDQGEDSSAVLSVSERAAALVLEAGGETPGTSSLGAGEDGSGLSLSWDEDTSVELLAHRSRASVGLATGLDTGEEDAAAGAELLVLEGRGSLQLRDEKGETTFDAP